MFFLSLGFLLYAFCVPKREKRSFQRADYGMQTPNTPHTRSMESDTFDDNNNLIVVYYLSKNKCSCMRGEGITAFDDHNHNLLHIISILYRLVHDGLSVKRPSNAMTKNAFLSSGKLSFEPGE